MKRKTKYTVRADGYIEYAPTYKGKRKHFYGSSDAEIERKVRTWKDEVDKGHCEFKPTFKAVAEKWWETKESELSINSVNNYRKAYDRAVDEFGKMPIDTITPQIVYQWLNRFKLQDYSSKVINNTKGVLKQILDQALIDGYIMSNPCVALPTIKGKAKTPRESASDEDIAKIEQFKTESNISRMFFFMLYTGARLGEASALQQKDIDREGKTASVTKSLAYGGLSAPILKAPKTETSVRQLELLDTVLETLPIYDDPETYIFFPDGFPTKGSYQKQIDGFRKAHGIEATPHQLRHSYASMLHSAGIDIKDAAELLGHTDTALTMNIYTHLENSHKTEILDVLNKYVKEHRMS